MSPAVRSGPASVCSRRWCLRAARPEAAAEPLRAKSSVDRGMGPFSSSVNWRGSRCSGGGLGREPPRVFAAAARRAEGLAALLVDRVFRAPLRAARAVFLLFPAAAARREPRARPAAFFALFL